MNTNSSSNLKKLIDIGIALSKEKNIDILLEKILTEARIISNSDGGTVYLINDDDTKLDFKIIHNKTLNFNYGGSSEPVPESIYPVKLYNQDNTKNLNNVSAVSAFVQLIFQMLIKMRNLIFQELKVSIQNIIIVLSHF